MTTDVSQPAPDEPVEPSGAGDVTRSAWPLVAVLLFVAIAAPLWYWQSAGSAQAEREGKQAIIEAGGLAVMDASQRHVASVSIPASQGDALANAAFELLPAFDRIESLDVSGLDVTEERAAVISRLDSLKSLTLNNANLDDQRLSQLGGLTNLETLNLANTNITGAGLAALTELDKLKMLDVSGTQVSSDLGPLAELDKLQWLVMRNLTLRQGAVEALANCPSLTRLSVSGTKIPDDEGAALRAARPGLSVDDGNDAAYE